MPCAGEEFLDGMVEHNVANAVRTDKELRRDIDAIIQRLKAAPGSAERTLSLRKLQEAVMWLGMDLKRLGELQQSLGVVPTAANPYPESKNPDSPVVHPTADGLKL